MTENIDPRMRELVYTLNRIRGVTTFSSCGGHAKPKPGQTRRGEFYVCFDVDRTVIGWRALEIVTWGIYQSDPERTRVYPWLGGDDPETMAFEVKGIVNANPDALSATLKRGIRRWQRPRS